MLLISLFIFYCLQYILPSWYSTVILSFQPFSSVCRIFSFFYVGIDVNSVECMLCKIWLHGKLGECFYMFCIYWLKKSTSVAKKGAIIIFLVYTCWCEFLLFVSVCFVYKVFFDAVLCSVYFVFKIMTSVKSIFLVIALGYQIEKSLNDKSCYKMKMLKNAWMKVSWTALDILTNRPRQKQPLGWMDASQI